MVVLQNHFCVCKPRQVIYRVLGFEKEKIGLENGKVPVPEMVDAI